MDAEDLVIKSALKVETDGEEIYLQMNPTETGDDLHCERGMENASTFNTNVSTDVIPSHSIVHPFATLIKRNNCQRMSSRLWKGQRGHAKRARIPHLSEADHSMWDRFSECFRIIARLFGYDFNSETPIVPIMDPTEFLGTSYSNSVLEQIFEYLETCDLLQCRLVCHQWESIITLKLQLNQTINFFFFRETYLTPKWKRLKELNKLLFHKRKLRLEKTSFFCTEFSFEGGSLNETTLQDFLNLHGNTIKKLTLAFALNSSKHNAELDEKTKIELVQDLITRQAPNVEYLHLGIYSESDCNLENRKEDSSSSFQHQRRRQVDLLETLKESNYGYGFSHLNSFYTKKLNTNLKIFKYFRSKSWKIFEMVVNLAPNLQEILVTGENLSYLYLPVNRLEYLKELYIHPQDLAEFEKLVFISCGSTGLSITSLILHFDSNLLNNDLGLQRRFVSSLNRILECCSESLEFIQWNPVTLLLGIRWPDIMSQVRRLRLGNPTDNRETQGLFPKDEGMLLLFPNLKFVILDAVESRSSLLKLLYSFDFDPVSSVKIVDVRCRFLNSDRLFIEDKKVLQNLFPNAQITAVY